MTKTFVASVVGLSVLLLAGWGCTKNDDLALDTTETQVISPNGEVLGTMDGKGEPPYELCVTVDNSVTGNVWLYAANNTAPRVNWAQWFSAAPVTTGKAGEEMCGAMNFAVKSGDKLYVNGAWQNGKKYLVYAAGSEAKDVVKEIWLDDQSYELGKECAYESNGKGGYNIVCTVR